MELIVTREGFGKATNAGRARGQRVGLVPTMGALHEGHASLVTKAASQCDLVAVSIFVNPIQFSSAEDLAKYPAGEPATRVEPGPVASRLEGASRPGHFAGVATVVTKLLSLCGHCRAYFGEKDFQQLVVVRRFVDELDIDAEIVGCPIVREADGLACSSRNRRLTSADRQAATVLFKALVAARDLAVDQGEDLAAVERTMADFVDSEPRAKLDYAVVVDPVTLAPPGALAGELRLLISAEVGPVRLIDNMGVHL